SRLVARRPVTSGVSRALTRGASAHRARASPVSCIWGAHGPVDTPFPTPPFLQSLSSVPPILILRSSNPYPPFLHSSLPPVLLGVPLRNRLRPRRHARRLVCRHHRGVPPQLRDHRGGRAAG